MLCHVYVPYSWTDCIVKYNRPKTCASLCRVCVFGLRRNDPTASQQQYQVLTVNSIIQLWHANVNSMIIVKFHTTVYLRKQYIAATLSHALQLGLNDKKKNIILRLFWQMLWYASPLIDILKFHFYRKKYKNDVWLSLESIPNTNVPCPTCLENMIGRLGRLCITTMLHF